MSFSFARPVTALVILGAMVSRLSAADLYVAPDGSDQNAGTREKPLATLARARDAARELKAKSPGPVTVYLRGGTYYLPEPLVLTAADSGSKEAPVTWQAYEKETPVVSGGVKLQLKWEPHKDGILKAKMPSGVTVDRLFVNGKLQPQARYPNYDAKQVIYNGFAADALDLKRTARWADPAGGFIHAGHVRGWGGVHFLITGKNPDGSVALGPMVGNGQNQPGMNTKYRFVENIFEELDAPGEWFLNGKTGTLYFYPPADADLAAAVVEGARLRQLIEFRGTAKAPVRFVTVKGLTMRHAARTFMDTKEPLGRSDWAICRAGAIFCNGTEDCRLEDCFIDGVGGNAVFANSYNRRLTVRGCHIAEAGASGVCFVGDTEAARDIHHWGNWLVFDPAKATAANPAIDRTPGPKTDNYPADCLVDDCLIHDFGRVEKQPAGVQIHWASRITVRHCSIYGSPRVGINIGCGNWGGHVVEFCDVFDTMLESHDHGAFNSWGRDRFWELSGLDLGSADERVWEKLKFMVLLDHLEPNILRNSRWCCRPGFSWDIDLDDASSNYQIYNNLCLSGGGIKVSTGYYVTVENNIMVNGMFQVGGWRRYNGHVVRRNIFWADDYKGRRGMGTNPWGKEMDYNLAHKPGQTAPAPAKGLAAASRRDEHSLVADAMFVDPAAGDYRVKEGSPALKLGFQNFPMDQFGVQKPELKAIARTPQLPGAKAPAAKSK